LYEVIINLSNSEGSNGPYKVNINIVDTPPEFDGFSVDSMIGKAQAKVGKLFSYQLPDIINFD